MSELTEKICCIPCNTGGNNDALMAAMMANQNKGSALESAMLANGGGMGSQWNNPSIYK